MDYLPGDIITKLYFLLPTSDISNFRRTCKRADILATNDYIWQVKQETEYPNLHVSRSSWHQSYRSLTRISYIPITTCDEDQLRILRYLKYKKTSTLREFLLPLMNTIREHLNRGFTVGAQIDIIMLSPESNHYVPVGRMYIRHFYQNAHTTDKLSLHMFNANHHIHLKLDMCLAGFPDIAVPILGDISFKQLSKMMFIDVSIKRKIIY